MRALVDPENFANCDADNFLSPKFEASDAFEQYTCKKKEAKKISNKIIRRESQGATAEH